MTTDPLTNIQNTLTAHGKTVHRRGNTLQAQCPAHPDRTPSLTINPGTTQPLILHCHAGCTTTDILTALHLTWNDISNPPQPATNNTPPATYTYTDANWTPLYRIIRGPNKQFRQQHLTPNGEWANGRNNITPILYNLPTILAAINEHDTIHIVEGEKDADTLTAHGEIATTNPGGAGNFTPLMADTLQHATHVTIIADNDTAGHQHAEHVSRLLTERNIPHHITLPTHGKDISEQIGQGHPPLQLQPYTPHTTPHTDSHGLELIDWTTIHDRPDALTDGLIFPGRWTALYAPAKAGKSTILLAISLDIPRGHDTNTAEPRTPTPVLYIDAEMGRVDLHERLTGHGITNPATLTNWHATDLPQPFDTPQGAQQLHHTIQQHNIGCVIIDGLNGAVEGNENDDTTWRNFYTHTIHPLKNRGIAIITGDNTGKDISLGQRGSSVKQDKPDANALLKRTDNGVTITIKQRRTAAYHPETLLAVHNIDNTAPTVVKGIQRDWARGTAECAAVLDGLNVAIDITNKTAQEALRDAGEKYRNNVIADAIRYRKTRDPFPNNP